MSTPAPPYGPGGTQPGGSGHQPGGWQAPPPPRSSRGGVRGLLIGLATTVVVWGVAAAGLVGVGALVADSGATDDVRISAAESTEEPTAAGSTADEPTADEPTADEPTAEDDAATGEAPRSGDGVGVASGDGVHEFGRTVTFEDGSTLTVAAPVPFTLAEYAAGGEDFDHHVKFKATFVNKTAKAFDPSYTTSSITSGEREGDAVFQEGLDMPANKVLPGKKITWWMGFGVDDPDDLQLTVAMGFLDYEDVIFTG